MIQKQNNPLRPGKNYISACSARCTASRDCEQRKHWASASPRLRAIQQNEAGGSLLLSNAVEKDPVVSLIPLFVIVLFFCSCCSFRKTRTATSERGLARMCNSILQLGSIMQKRKEEKEEPRKTEISSYAKHLR